MNAYTVVSEFKFDVGQAIVQSEALQASVDGLSASVIEASNSLKNLGVGFLASALGGGATGLLGIFYSAINASDKFTQSQIELANAMVANKMTIGNQVITFTQGLEKGSELMDEIVQKSQQMNIDPNQWIGQFKMFNNMLAPKGLSGDNLKNSMELSRVSLKAAPALGVSGDQAQMGIMAGISGQLSKDTHFGSRLFMEAGDAISEATKGAIKDLKSFNAAKPDMRIKALIAGLDKLAGSADTVAARAATFSATLGSLKNLFYGAGSILKPLGDVLIPALLKILNIGIEYLNTKGRELVKLMSSFMGELLEDPKKLFLEVEAMKSLSGNFKLAGEIAGIAMFFMHIKQLAAHFPIVGKGLAWITSFLPTFGGGLAIIGKLFGYIWRGFLWVIPHLGPLISGLAQFAGLTAVLTAAFHGIVRGMARVKLEFFEYLANNAVAITEKFMILKDALAIIFAPLLWVADGFEELTFAMMGGTGIMEFFKNSIFAFIDALKWASEYFAVFYATWRGLIAGMFDVLFRTFENLGTIISNLLNGDILDPMKGTKNIFAGYTEAAGEEFVKTMEKFSKPGTVENGGGANVSNHQHNYDVKMTNNFKEVLQPDRIAFTIKDQLTKASQNRTQGRASGTAALQGKAI